MSIIYKMSELESKVNRFRKRGDKIVFTSGCFDLLHIGHTRMLKQASKFGDILFVGINSDESIKKIKGNERPIIEEKFRYELLDEIKWVDFIVPFDEETPIKLIEVIKPNFLINSAELSTSEIAGYYYVLKNGGESIQIQTTKNISTSKIIEKISYIY